MITQRISIVGVAAALAALPATVATAPAQARAAVPVPVPVDMPAPTDPVDDVAQRGPIAYLGGPSAIGRNAGGAGVIDAATGALRHPLPGGGAFAARAAAPDGAGGWYLGGVTGARPPLVHLLADGRLDPAFDPPIRDEDRVNALVRHGGRLYVGGNLVADGGRVDLLGLDPRTGALDPGFRAPYALGPGDRENVGEVAPQVTALAVAGDSLWVAHQSPGDAGGWGDRLDRLDPATGAPLAPPAPEVRPIAFAVDGERVAVLRRDATPPIVAYDARTATPLPGHAFDLGEVEPNGLAARDGVVYVANGTDEADGPVVAFDAATGARRADFHVELPETTYAGGWAYAVAAGPNAVYLSVDDHGRPARRVLALDPRTGARLPGFSSPAADSPRFLAAAGSDVVAGGWVWTVGARPIAGLAAVDLRSGEIVPGFAPPPLAADVLRCDLGTAGRVLVVHIDHRRGRCRGGRLHLLSATTGERLAAARSPAVQGLRGLTGTRDRVVALTQRRGHWRLRMFRPDGSPGHDLAIRGEVRGIAATRGRVYLSGRLALARHRRLGPVVAVNARTGLALPGFARRPAGLREAVAVAASGRTLLLGPAGTRRPTLWRLDARTGRRTRIYRGRGVPTRHLRIAGGRALGLWRRYLRVLDLSGGRAAVHELEVLGRAIDRYVLPKVAIHGDRLLVAGDFEFDPRATPESRLLSYVAGFELR